MIYYSSDTVINIGTLQVHVYGDFLPRSIFGRFMVLCAIVRAIYLAIAVTLIGVLRQADVVFCDQVSAWIPILKYAGARVSIKREREES
jgi:alpha-1,3/alpha-1,6-mannosyltransferase